MEDDQVYLLMWSHIRSRKHDKRWWDSSRNLLEVSPILYRKEDSPQDEYYGQVLCSPEEDRRSCKIIKNLSDRRDFLEVGYIELILIIIHSIKRFLECLRDDTEILI